MALPSKKDNFTFNHLGQPDDLGLAYNGDFKAIQQAFDSRGEELRIAYNNLLDSLKLSTADDSGAKGIGISPITGITGTNIQDALASLKTAIDSVTVGSIPDESIGIDKLSDVLNDLHRQGIVNGEFKVSDYSTLNISNAYGQTPANSFHAKADTINITGTVEKITNTNITNKKDALKFTLTSSSDTGRVYLMTRLPSQIAKAYVGEVASFGIKAYQSVLNKDYKLSVCKADALDDFTATTLISELETTLATNEGTVTLPNISMGDCSNGIEIVLSFTPMTVGGETFEFTDFTMNKGKYLKPISPISLYDTQIKLGQFNEHKAENVSEFLDIRNLIAGVTNSSYFSPSRNVGWFKDEKTGIILQWGLIGAVAGTGTATVTFPIAFPNGVSQAYAVANYTPGDAESLITNTTMQTTESKSAAIIYVRLPDGTNPTAYKQAKWWAIGS